jgi:hypothetical protein
MGSRRVLGNQRCGGWVLVGAFGHGVPSYVYYGQEKTPTELTIGVLGVKA